MSLIETAINREKKVAYAQTERILGYARVSTRAQDLDYQIKRLTEAGCTRIYREKRSGKNTTERPELSKLLGSLKAGDLLLATTSDRIARDPVDLLNILRTANKEGAGLRLLDEPFIDTTSEMADLIVFLVGWAARWQRRRILENTAHGREMARARGVKFGRKPKLSQAQKKTIQQSGKQGQAARKLAHTYGVSQSTIRRIQKSGSGQSDDYPIR